MSKTPNEVLTAMRDFGVDIKTCDGWDRGRQPEWRGIINHHTATASASVSNPDPSLWWLLNAYDKPAANLLVGKTPGHTWFAGVDSYHCGLGGPWVDAGIPQGNYPQYMLGIEIDDPGTKVGTLTDYQIENTAKINASIIQLFDLPLTRIITHGCWTNGCHGVNPKGPSYYLGRKNDTLEGGWGQYPGESSAKPYNAPWWREKAATYLDGNGGVVRTWDGTIPSLEACRNAFKSLETENIVRNKAAWRVACRLYDLGIRDRESKPLHEQGWARSDVKKFRESLGWEGGDGAPSERLLKRLFGASK